MEFKIDAKANYVLITPERDILNAETASALKEKVQELINNHFQNFIVDLQQANRFEVGAGDILMDLHHYLYDQNHSLVFTNIQDSVLQSLKKGQFHLGLNLSPTLIEAIDIVNMEILEREILNEPS